jgi:RecJ-like exonuclease
MMRCRECGGYGCPACPVVHCDACGEARDCDDSGLCRECAERISADLDERDAEALHEHSSTA